MPFALHVSELNAPQGHISQIGNGENRDEDIRGMQLPCRNGLDLHSDDCANMKESFLRAKIPVFKMVLCFTKTKKIW